MVVSRSDSFLGIHFTAPFKMRSRSLRVLGYTSSLGISILLFIG